MAPPKHIAKRSTNRLPLTRPSEDQEVAELKDMIAAPGHDRRTCSSPASNTTTSSECTSERKVISAKRPTRSLPAKKGKQAVEEALPDEEVLRLNENQPRIKQKLTVVTEAMRNLEENMTTLKENNLFIALAGERNR